MKPPLRASAALVVVAALAWHALSVTTKVSAPAVASRESATFHFAAQVAAMGGDPYDAVQVRSAARREGARNVVAPLRAPPPALALGAWSVAMHRETGWSVMVAIQAAAIAAGGLVLAAWWRPLGPVAFALAAVLAAAASSAPVTIASGGGAGLAMAVALGAGRIASQGSPVRAGALIGLAGAVDPRLLVLAVLLIPSRRLASLAAAAAGFLVAHLAILPFAGLQLLRWYWQVVAPRHLLGDATGVVQPFSKLGNHALVGLAGVEGEVLPLGLVAAQLAGLALGLLALGWLFRRPTADPVAQVARCGTLLVLTLLFGLVTPEGDLVLALPAAAAVAVAVVYGSLSSRWTAPLAVALAVVGSPAAQLATLGDALLPSGSPALLLFREGATLALLVLFAAAVRAGASTVPAPAPALAEPAPAALSAV